jgi:protein SCO1/2
MKWITCALCVSLLAVGLGGRASAADPPPIDHHDMSGMHNMPALDTTPGDSLYQLDFSLEPVGNAPVRFASLRGEPLLVTMFYSHCTSVCPLVTTQLQHMVAALAPADRRRLRILMLSFDTVRDTPQALAAFMAEHHIRDPNWLIARAKPGDVRALAAALGIQYRELPDHSFNHSALITLLDAQGVPRARTQTITAQDPEFLSSVRALLAAESPKPIDKTP